MWPRFSTWIFRRDLKEIVLRDDKRFMDAPACFEEGQVQPNSIRIVVGDAHGIVRYGLRSLLAAEDDFEIVGEAVDGHQALDQTQERNPDVLLMDLHLPRLDGCSVLKVLRQSNQSTKVLAWTDSDDKAEFVQAMRLGCSGIISKQTAPQMIVKCIRKVHGGEIWLDSCTTAAVMVEFADSGVIATPECVRSQNQPSISKRERDIVQLVAQGLKNKDIAEKLFISEQTVKNHMHNVFDKLGVSDRLELALYTISQGWHAV
jgi:DNA-binding NarL/FixJ family response regulator